SASPDPRHRGPGRLAPRAPGAASHRPSPGDAHRDPGRPGAGAEGTPAPGSLAGQAAGRAEPAGAGHLAGRRADPGEAQPVLTGRPRRLLAARPWRRPATQPRRAGLRTFASLGTRNYRLFITGQVVSNTGTWMQRVAQDWLVLELTHGSGTALGIAAGLQFLPQLLFSLWGGMIADRYPKR